MIDVGDAKHVVIQHSASRAVIVSSLDGSDDSASLVQWCRRCASRSPSSWCI